MVEMSRVLDPFRFLLVAVSGWMKQCQLQAVDYLREERRVLREQLGGRRIRLNDDQRRRLAGKAKGLARKILAEVATLVTPETLLAWHRKLIAKKYDGTSKRADRAALASPERSKRWWFEWPKRIVIGAIGESKERCRIWDMRLPAAQSPRS
jgi:hypothetical protein